MKIIIQRDQLVAALCTAGVSDARNYLNSVYVEATNLETRLTSTDGVMLSVQRADAKGDNEVVGVVRMIVPRAALEKVKKDKYLRTIEINDEGGKMGVVDYAARTTFEPMDAVYPDVRRVLPTNPSGVSAQFNPELIAKFVKAAAALGIKAVNVNVVPSGVRDAALVTFENTPSYVGGMMALKRPGVTAPEAWAVTELAAETALDAIDLV